MAPYMHDCEFCREMRTPAKSLFGKLYAGAYESRIVRQTTNFVAMPTIGQLVPGSLLILPVRHFETMGSLSASLRIEMQELLNGVWDIAAQFGHPIYFEHGSTQEIAGSCGIFHAHMHLVPVPKKLQPSEFFPESQGSAASLDIALQSVGRSHHYLLAGNKHQTLYANVSELDFTPGSQFFRRRLAALLGITGSWDWRLTTSVEDAVLATLEAFHAKSTAESF